MWTRAITRSQSGAAAADAIHHSHRSRCRSISSTGTSSIRKSSPGFIAHASDVVSPPRCPYYYKKQQRPCFFRDHHREYHSHHHPGYDHSRLPRPRAMVTIDVDVNNPDSGNAEPARISDDDFDYEFLDCSQYDDVPPPPPPPKAPKPPSITQERVAAIGQNNDEDDPFYSGIEIYDGGEEEDSDDEESHDIDITQYEEFDLKEDDSDLNEEDIELEPVTIKREPPPMSRITVWEAAKILNRACTLKRGIKLNKRQRLKAWIPALLLHRYDRGIRDRDELNHDNVYYHPLYRNNWGIGGGGYDHDPHMIDTNNPIKDYVDLRKVLKPPEHEVHSFIHSLHNCPGANEADRKLFNFTKKARKRAKAFLIKEKSALFAHEARLVMKDRNVPFLELTGMESEEEVGKFAEKHPGIFLSYFCKAMALVEVEADEREDRGIMDFTHLRHYAPSLDGDYVVREGAAGEKAPQPKKRKKGKGGHRPGQHPNQLRALSMTD